MFKKYIFRLIIFVFSAIFFSCTQKVSQKKDYICIVSDKQFLFYSAKDGKTWDGTLYYSPNPDVEEWRVWYGEPLRSAGSDDGFQYLYLQGNGNTYITTNPDDGIPYPFCLEFNDIDDKGTIEVYGDIMCLLNHNLPQNALMEDHCFDSLFKGSHWDRLTVAPELPAKNLSPFCYASMFEDCSSLILPPELPAKSVQESSYASMFKGCKKLSKAPALPATTISKNSYNSMFSSCKSLIIPPTLPAKVMAEGCYDRMFELCVKLIKTPDLPAKTLAKECYTYMFSNCSSLTKPQKKLPATTLVEGCYSYMFTTCKSLKEPPILPATNLANNCYECMFLGCDELEKFPNLPATKLMPGCYQYMLNGCDMLEFTESVKDDFVNPVIVGEVPEGEEYESYKSNLDYVYCMFFVYVLDARGNFVYTRDSEGNLIKVTDTPVPGKTYYTRNPIVK